MYMSSVLFLFAATRIFLCGRVKIEVQIKPEELVPDLVCEECEKDAAVVKCEACNEVFCSKCNVLCHQRNWILSLEHDHVIEDKIRPIKVRACLYIYSIYIYIYTYK